VAAAAVWEHLFVADPLNAAAGARVKAALKVGNAVDPRSVLADLLKGREEEGEAVAEACVAGGGRQRELRWALPSLEVLFQPLLKEIS
jgi:hypothetical protein